MNKVNILYIGNKLSKHGNTPSTVETLSKQLESLGCNVITVGEKKNKILRFIEMQSSIFKYKDVVDYVLIDTYSTLAFWFAFSASVLCGLFKMKYIPILHGGDLPSRLDRNPKLSRKLFENSYVNVAVSNYLFEEFRKRNLDSVIIPNNIDVGNYLYKERKQIEPNFLWVRSFHKDYNPDMMIEIILSIKDKYPRTKVCMIGPDKDGSMDRVKNEVNRLRLDEHFEITGRLSKKDWIKKSENYDIFINTTNYDNTPVSVIEAMSLGLPVVSTNAGGLPYLLENGVDSLLSDVGDVSKMIYNIETILEDNELGNQYAQNARKKAESFDWDQVSEKWLKILN